MIKQTHSVLHLESQPRRKLGAERAKLPRKQSTKCTGPRFALNRIYKLRGKKGSTSFVNSIVCIVSLLTDSRKLVWHGNHI